MEWSFVDYGFEGSSLAFDRKPIEVSARNPFLTERQESYF